MSKPLSPREAFPAGHLEISQRFIRLRTGVTMRVAECGPHAGTPVVLFPGWGASLYTYRHAFERLSAHDIRVIGVDLRGFGWSDKPAANDAYSLASYCADVDALLDALELPRVALVGQSMGGGLALRYALRTPKRVDRIVLINPTGLSPLGYIKTLSASPRRLVTGFGRRIVPRFVVGLILRQLAYGHAELVTERDVDEYWTPTQLPGFVHAARACLSEFNWSAITDREAEGLAVPAMVMLGASDRLIRGGSEGAKRIARATIHVLDGGHCVHEERPDETYQLIGDFIRPRTTSAASADDDEFGRRGMR